jgi:hypothetical protein
MSPHPYLRAYLAGVAVPTFVLPLFLVMFAFGRFVYNVPIPFERVIVFPLALLPVLWGVWNTLYCRFELHRRIPIGFYGAILILLFLPVGYAMSRVVLEWSIPVPFFLSVILPLAMIMYYLLWKYAVAFFNRLLGLV